MLEFAVFTVVVRGFGVWRRSVAGTFRRGRRRENEGLDSPCSTKPETLMQRKGIENVDHGLGKSLRQFWGLMQEMSRMMETAHGLDASPGSRGEQYEWEPVVSEMPADDGLLLYFELPGVEREVFPIGD